MGQPTSKFGEKNFGRGDYLRSTPNISSTCSHWPRNLERCNAGIPILTDVDNSGERRQVMVPSRASRSVGAEHGRAATSRCLSALSRLSDLAVVKALDITQHQRLAEWRRQCRDGDAQMFSISFSYEFCLRRRRRLSAGVLADGPHWWPFRSNWACPPHPLTIRSGCCGIVEQIPPSPWRRRRRLPSSSLRSRSSVRRYSH